MNARNLKNSAGSFGSGGMGLPAGAAVGGHLRMLANPMSEVEAPGQTVSDDKRNEAIRKKIAPYRPLGNRRRIFWNEVLE
jgi:hypothetical protein